MKQLGYVLLLCATTAAAQSSDPRPAVARAADDGKVIDRVAEVSRKDLPSSLLRRIVDEDIELLRGKRSDGTYQHAGYERFESARISNSYSIEPAGTEKLTTIELKGPFVYRLEIESPSRRMLVTKNRRIWLDHVEIESIPENSQVAKHQDVKLEAWLEPGQSRTVDLTDIARQATARVFARVDKDSGYGNLNMSLIQARVFDHADSPYADAVASAKAIQRGLDRSDIASIRSMATRMTAGLEQLAGTPAARTIDVPAGTAPRPSAGDPPPLNHSVSTAPASEGTFAELQAIEDLLTGSEAEKRQGLDRLHQLLRRMRK